MTISMELLFEDESKYWSMTNLGDDLMAHFVDKHKLTFLFTNLCKNSLSSKNSHINLISYLKKVLLNVLELSNLRR